ANTAQSLQVSYKTASGEVDQNGNAQTLAAGSDALATLGFAPGTNQLSSFTPTGGSSVLFEYEPNGAIAKRAGNGVVDDLVFTYVDGTQRPSTVTNTTTDVAVRFDYDANGYPVRTQPDGGQASIYFPCCGGG